MIITFLLYFLKILILEGEEYVSGGRGREGGKGQANSVLNVEPDARA